MAPTLILRCAVIDEDRTPDWDAAVKRIETLTESDLDENSHVLEPYAGDEEQPAPIEQLRGALRHDLRALRAAIEDGRHPELDYVVIRGVRIWVTGGTSYGDDPTELCGPMSRLEAAGVLAAAGFDGDDEPSERLAATMVHTNNGHGGEIGALYHVATGGEVEVLDALRQRAGTVWECYGRGGQDSCWTNPAARKYCESCGVPRQIGELEEHQRPRQPRLILEGQDAITRASREQRGAYKRLRARCSIRGTLLFSDGNLQVGFESRGGRDRDALIAPDGRRLGTTNSTHRR